MKRCAIYARVSSEKQGTEGTSLDTQTASCKQYADAQGYTVVRAIQEDLSGATLSRPGLDTLRDMAQRREINALICYAPDRLSRDLLDMLLVKRELDAVGCELLFATLPYDSSPFGTIQLQVLGMVAELEKKQIAERMRRGKEKALTDGRILSRMAPYGYKRVGQAFEVDEVEARVVREIFDLMAGGNHSLYSIALRMRERGYPNKRKGNWWVSTIHRILLNETYTGTYHAALAHWKDGKRTAKPRSEWIAIEVPPIITRDLFELARARIWANSAYSNRNTRKSYMLAGMIRCARCGINYRSWRSVKGDNVYKYYSCPKRVSSYARKSGEPPCKNQRLRALEMDSFVWNALCDYILYGAPLVEEEAPQGPTPTEQALNALEATTRELEALQREEEALITAYRREVITIDQLSTQLADISGKRASVEERKQQAQTVLSTAPKVSTVDTETLATLRGQLDVLREHYTDTEKRAVMKLLKVKVTIDGQVISIDSIAHNKPQHLRICEPVAIVS